MNRDTQDSVRCQASICKPQSPEVTCSAKATAQTNLPDVKPGIGRLLSFPWQHTGGSEGVGRGNCRFFCTRSRLSYPAIMANLLSAPIPHHQQSCSRLLLGKEAYDIALLYGLVFQH